MKMSSQSEGARKRGERERKRGGEVGRESVASLLPLQRGSGIRRLSEWPMGMRDVRVSMCLFISACVCMCVYACVCVKCEKLYVDKIYVATAAAAADK